MGCLVMGFVQFYCWVEWWKSFVNRSVFVANFRHMFDKRWTVSGVGRVISCVGEFSSVFSSASPCSKKKPDWAINTKLGAGRMPFDPEVSRSKVKVAGLSSSPGPVGGYGSLVGLVSTPLLGLVLTFKIAGWSTEISFVISVGFVWRARSDVECRQNIIIAD